MEGDRVPEMAMKKVTVSMTDEMYADLEEIRKQKRLATVAETARAVIGEYLAQSDSLKKK
jgi:metal-responsive CopG/Arc/MetJ family transcriptional regulator